MQHLNSADKPLLPCLNVLVLYCNVPCIDKPATVNAYNGEQLYGFGIKKAKIILFQTHIFFPNIFLPIPQQTFSYRCSESLWFSEPLDTKQEFSNSKLQAAFTVSSYRQPAKLNSSEGVAHALFSSPGENFKV